MRVGDHVPFAGSDPANDAVGRSRMDRSIRVSEVERARDVGPDEIAVDDGEVRRGRRAEDHADAPVRRDDIAPSRRVLRRHEVVHEEMLAARKRVRTAYAGKHDEAPVFVPAVEAILLDRLAADLGEKSLLANPVAQLPRERVRRGDLRVARKRAYLERHPPIRENRTY